MIVAVPKAWHTSMTLEQRQDILHQHLSIGLAIQPGDAEGAVVGMRAHFDASIGELFKREGP